MRNRRREGKRRGEPADGKGKDLREGGGWREKEKEGEGRLAVGGGQSLLLFPVSLSL